MFSKDISHSLTRSFLISIFYFSIYFQKEKLETTSYVYFEKKYIYSWKLIRKKYIYTIRLEIDFFIKFLFHTIFFHFSKQLKNNAVVDVNNNDATFQLQLEVSADSDDVVNVDTNLENDDCSDFVVWHKQTD